MSTLKTVILILSAVLFSLYAEDNLVGTWKWVRSCGGFGYSCRTPASAGFAVSLKVTVDSIFSYKNDSLVASSSRSAAIKEDTLQLKIMGTISGKEVMQINPSTKDTLELRDQCMDCYTHYFAKCATPVSAGMNVMARHVRHADAVKGSVFFSILGERLTTGRNIHSANTIVIGFDPIRRSAEKVLGSAISK